MFFKDEVLNSYSFVYPAKQLYMDEIKAQFRSICRENNFSYKDLNNILVVIDEACSNIIKHAYAGAEGDMEFEVDIRKKGAYITIIDHGKSYNWRAFRTPNLNRYIAVSYTHLTLPTKRIV